MSGINFIQDFHKIRLGLCHSADWEMSNIDCKMPPNEDLTPFRRNKSVKEVIMLTSTHLKWAIHTNSYFSEDW